METTVKPTENESLNTLMQEHKYVLIEALHNYLTKRFKTSNIDEDLLDQLPLVQNYVEQRYPNQNEFFKNVKKDSVRANALAAIKLISALHKEL